LKISSCVLLNIVVFEIIGFYYWTIFILELGRCFDFALNVQLEHLARARFALNVQLEHLARVQFALNAQLEHLTFFQFALNVQHEKLAIFQF